MPQAYKNRTRTKREIRFYNTTEWRKMRIAFLAENPFCLFCEERSIDKLANIADHIVPITVNWDLRFDWDNLRPLCKECHDNLSQLNRKTMPPRTYSDGSPNPEFRRMWELFRSQA